MKTYSIAVALSQNLSEISLAGQEGPILKSALAFPTFCWPRYTCNRYICVFGCKTDHRGCPTSKCCPSICSCPSYRKYFNRSTNCWHCRTYWPFLGLRSAAVAGSIDNETQSINDDNADNDGNGN
ncbi:unnamed protein product [Gordionus sp. m RMFG-2023]